MAADQETFQQILSSLLSTDNDVRTAAEKTYGEVPIDVRAIYLLQTLQNSGLSEDMRQVSAVLLRRILTSDFTNFFLKLQPANQNELKSCLLHLLRTELSHSLRQKVCELVAELARNLIDEEGNNLWPEFLQFLFQCSNSENTVLKESALRIFATIPGIFSNQQVVHVDMIKQMLQQSLLSTYDVRFHAVRAVSAFIMLYDKDDPIHKIFKDLLPAIFQVIAESVEKNEDDTLLKCLIELAESAPKFLRPQLTNIMQLVLKILPNEDMENSWKHLVLETVVTLSEVAPVMMRRDAAPFIPLLIPQILKLMTDLDDSPDWSYSDEILEDDNDSNCIVAESTLDRLACGLGGKTILPQVISNIPPMLANPDWKYRQGALMAISAIAEGCSKQMEPMLPQILDGILSFLYDSHHRVRYAACNAIGQMSSDFAPTFQKKFHDKVIPGLLMVLNDEKNPRVQAHGAAALINFSEDCPSQILLLYLNLIMAKLEVILNEKLEELICSGKKLVLEQVVSTIASVADTSGEHFAPYYDRLMPFLKYIIQNTNKPELKLLRGKTIECVSLIGLAVGREKFMRDATDIMDLCLKTYTDGQALPDDDPQTSYLITAWARMCKILGKQFEQYLPVVIEPVMRAASLKPEVAVMDNEDMGEVSNGEEWQFISLGEQQNFGIRTTGIEDKASACDMLVCYARELKEGFAPYAEPVCKLMVRMLKFYFHDGVRTAAAQSLPYLLECAKVNGGNFLSEMWEFICPELLKSIETDPETEVKHEHMYSMAKCIETLGKGCMTKEWMKELMRVLDGILKNHFERAVERIVKRKDEDYDEVVEEQLEDEDNEDNYTLGKVADILHALFLTYREEFYEYFDLILGHFVKLVGTNQPWSDRQWGLCVFDDVIEFGGPACVKYEQYFLRPIVEGVTDKNSAVRQAAAYGCGTLAINGGPSFAGTCAEVLPRLAEVISDAGSRSEENISATENAISAITKILQHNNSKINVNEILPHWLSWLPVWEDSDEAPHVYGYLCQLIETNNAIILGQNNSNIPRLAEIITEALNREAISLEHPIGQRMANILTQIRGSGKMFQACCNLLSTEQGSAENNFKKRIRQV